MTSETLLLLTWLSPAFPTGAYAYSHGLEWAVEAGDVTDEATAAGWVLDAILDGAGRADAILLRHAHRTRSAEELDELADLAAAAQPCAERRLETTAQGEAFLRAASVWDGPTLTPALSHRHGRGGSDVTAPSPVLTGEGRGEGDAAAYPVALGALAVRHGIAEDAAALGLLHAFAANLISACVRLVPLGQTAGLRIQAGLASTLLTVAEETKEATLDDLGTACFRAEIASMRHETQRTRLFRS